MSQHLSIFQSLWAMARRHTDGSERSLDDNVRMIAEAGFDGISAHYTDRAYARRSPIDRVIRRSILTLMESLRWLCQVDGRRLPAWLKHSYP